MSTIQTISEVQVSYQSKDICHLAINSILVKKGNVLPGDVYKGNLLTDFRE